MFDRATLSTIASSLAIALVTCLQSPQLHAQDSAEAGSDSAVQKPAIPRLDATVEKALREHLGHKATVFGKIKRTKASDKGITFLNFEGYKFVLVCFESEYANFPDGPLETTMRDKYVEATGYISEYKGKLQIKLTQPDQIKIVQPPAPPSDSAEKDKQKKKKGTDSKDKKEAKPKKVDPKKYFC